MSLLRTTALATLIAFVGIAPIAQAQAQTHNVDTVGLDTSVKPGDDFYAYANGGWIKSAEIPADRSSYGPGVILVEKTSAQVKELIQKAADSNPPKGSDAQKVGDYYASYVDEAGIEAKGLTPVMADMAAIGAIADKAALTRYLGGTLRADVDALNATDFYTDHVLGLWVTQSLNDPSKNAAYLLQGGLGMPDRDYYLSDAEAMTSLRTQYQAYVAKILTLGGVADADAKAALILAFETKLAQAHGSRADSADVGKANNPWSRADFMTKAPGMDWDAYFAAAGLSSQSDFIVWHPGATTGIAALVASEPLDVWKDYLTFITLNHFANLLPKAFVDARFAFYGTALSGTPKMQDRWKRGIGSTNAAVGEIVGKLYVERYFPPSAKAKIESMVQDEITAFHARIDNLSWMAPETKTKALAKLGSLRVGVGYPDTWTDYSKLDVVRGDAVGNAKRAEIFYYHTRIALLNKAPLKGEWVMTPQTVNAVNLPIANGLNFPAAILQPPYFDPEADAAYNYGAIGAIIGHEISHSFDDQGAQFDAEGHFTNWWTPEDLAHFQAAGAALAAQYDKYCPFPGVCVNGKLTLSENIADVAGLAAAHDAYLLSLNGKPDAIVDGMTGEQRFFLAFAQSWRDTSREASLRQQLTTDSHSPDEFRGDTVRNLDAWYDAFNVKPGDAMYLPPDQRVKVW